MNNRLNQLNVFLDRLKNTENAIKSTEDFNDFFYDALKSLSVASLSDLRENFTIINDLLIRMGKLDFSQRLPINNEEDVYTYLCTALNYLCEELEEKIVPRHYETFQLITEGVVITNNEGVIKFSNKSFSRFIKIEEKDLKGKNIFNFIEVDKILLDLRNEIGLENISLTFKTANKELAVKKAMVKEVFDKLSHDYIFIIK